MTKMKQVPWAKQILGARVERDCEKSGRTEGPEFESIGRKSCLQSLTLTFLSWQKCSPLSLLRTTSSNGLKKEKKTPRSSSSWAKPLFIPRLKPKTMKIKEIWESIQQPLWEKVRKEIEILQLTWTLRRPFPAAWSPPTSKWRKNGIWNLIKFAERGGKKPGAGTLKLYRSVSEYLF